MMTNTTETDAGEANAGALLKVRNLGCDRGGVPVVRGVDLTLAGGDSALLFGRNGSGKSSILLALAGLVRAVEGTIEQAVPLVFAGHDGAFKPALTVFENLAFHARSYGVDRAAIAAVLTQVDLADKAEKRAGRLSAGQKRRLSLARCLLSRRRLWLLDEPTAALDREGQALVTDVLQAHLAGGGAAVIATHQDLDLSCNGSCHRIALQ